MKIGENILKIKKNSMLTDESQYGLQKYWIIHGPERPYNAVKMTKNN